MNTRVRVSLALIVGAAATAGAARILDVPGGDSFTLGWIAGGSAFAAGLLGAVILWLLRTRSLRTRVVIVSLSALGGAAAGAAIAAKEMFISTHDLKSLVVILIAAGAVALSISLWLGGSVADEADRFEEAVRRVSATETLDVEMPTSRELASIAKEIDSMLSRLREVQDRERSLDASRRELVAWVSHDLRTPLAGIRAMAEAIADGVVADPESVARYHESIVSEVDKLAGLVDDLFELSRINAGTLQLQMERVSLGEILSDTVAAASPMARSKGVTLEGQIGEPSLVLTMSSREMMRVFRNLVENAIRHTPSDGSVWVEARADDEHAYVSIADSCGGIPQQDIDRVFDVAFRGELARTPGDGGGGLGLAIAKGIVEAHAGDIDVQNEGTGCRFTVRLPLDNGSEMVVVP